jgi:hypothetical protein
VFNRRSFLRRGAALTLSATILPAAAQEPKLCQDPEELSSTDYSFRKYVEYTEAWPNKGENCSRCESFIPGDSDTACGRCRAIAGSINPNGHCTGWSVRKQEK